MVVDCTKHLSDKYLDGEAEPNQAECAYCYRAKRCLAVSSWQEQHHLPTHCIARVHIQISTVLPRCQRVLADDISTYNWTIPTPLQILDPFSVTTNDRRSGPMSLKISSNTCIANHHRSHQSTTIISHHIIANFDVASYRCDAPCTLSI
jgi:hypothetical protein